MPTQLSSDHFVFHGSLTDDAIADGFENPIGQALESDSETPARVNGLEGDDNIKTGLGNDLAAGDMVGDEWTLIEGEWVFDRDAIVVSNYGANQSYNDVIFTGAGNDVLLGNGGNDFLSAGAGHDILNAGVGDDRAFGGLGDDTLNLEFGNDYAEGGLGADIVNGGAGNDVIFGDLAGANLLANGEEGASTMDALAQSGGWVMTDDSGTTQISQSVGTVVGETYTIAFDLAANFSGRQSVAIVEVLWNGEVIDTIEATSGGFQTFEVEVNSTSEAGTLGFNAVQGTSGIDYDFDGPIISYEKAVNIQGQDVTVDAFAPGQSNLYQVINGQLNVFDVQTEEYTAVGDAPSFRTNAVGFNVEDNLIYGVAKSSGYDSLGNRVETTDIVMIDASGDTFRIGEGFYGDYVGDFDDRGNLWTFHSALNRISVIDVDALGGDGNPEISHFHFPSNMFTDRTYDIAFNAAEDCFYAVVAPSQNGGNGTVVRIDTTQVPQGGQPTFTELEITGTLFEDAMHDGMPRGAYGAVFFDGDGNLYFGLNRGDHDLNENTSAQGGIYQVNMDWQNGEAYTEFMAEAPATGSNDGAVDPRSRDAFTEIDANAPILLREPTLTRVEGSNDTLNGGEGNDEIHGNAGADNINGGAGEDVLSGDQGADRISAGSGDDMLYGGTGNDSLRGESGDDLLEGGAANDYLYGGSGADVLSGGEGIDRIVGGVGSDEIHSGAGNDQLWGGAWTGDLTSDTFVFEQGDGRDFVHDFEANHDVIDLSAFDINLSDVQGVTQERGWATIIDLSNLGQGQGHDRIVLLGVDVAELEESNFIF